MTSLIETLAGIRTRLSRRTTKATALLSLRDIIQTIDDGERPKDYDLAVLYDFFAPNKPAKTKGKDDFAWVAQAASIKDDRSQLCYVYANDKHLVATDGHRIHCVANQGRWAPGYYCPATGDKLDPATVGVLPKYPDYERLMRCDSGHHQVKSVDVTTLVEHEAPAPNKSLWWCIALPEYPDSLHVEPARVQVTYWNEVLNGSDVLAVDVHVPIHPGTHIRVDLPNDRQAVIMPIRQDLTEKETSS